MFVHSRFALERRVRSVEAMVSLNGCLIVPHLPPWGDSGCGPSAQVNKCGLPAHFYGVDLPFVKKIIGLVEMIDCY
jgi:hypothetical protein